MGCSFSSVCIPECLAHFLFEFLAWATDTFKYTAKGISTSAIKVYWAEPSGSYTFYKVKYKRHGHRWNDIRIDERGHKYVLITDLEPNTEYEISIKDKSIPVDQQEWLESIYAWTQRGHTNDCSTERSRLLAAQNV